MSNQELEKMVEQSRLKITDKIQSVRTLIIKHKNEGLYVSLKDIYKLMLEEGFYKNKFEMSENLWNAEKKVAKTILKHYNTDVIDSSNIPYILGFRDYFVSYVQLDKYLPNSKNNIINQIKTQFGFQYNCRDEVNFLEECYILNENILDNLQSIGNRLKN